MHPHALHASACLCMSPHVQPVFRPSDPHPVTKLLGSNIRPVHMPSGLVSWIVANPTQHPHPNRCVRPAAPQHPQIPSLPSWVGGATISRARSDILIYRSLPGPSVSRSLMLRSPNPMLRPPLSNLSQAQTLSLQHPFLLQLDLSTHKPHA